MSEFYVATNYMEQRKMSHEFVFKKLTCASCGFPLFCAQVQDPGVEQTCMRTSRCDRGSLQPHSHHIQL